MKRTLSILLAVTLIATMIMALLPTAASADWERNYVISSSTEGGKTVYYLTVFSNGSKVMLYGPYDSYAEALATLMLIQRMDKEKTDTTTLKQNRDTGAGGGCSISGVNRGAVKNNNLK